MTRADVDFALAALARRQHGAFSRAQARALGLSDSAIQRRVDTRWLRLDGGVYALPGNPSSWRRQCMAATLAVQGATISGRAAAVLHRFDGFSQAAVEITVPRGSSHHTRLARIRQSDLFEATVVDRIPVVTVPQTVVDLARVLSRERLGRVVGDLVVRHPAALSAIQDRYVALAHSRQKGIASLRTALERYGSGYVPPDGELEWRLDRALAQVPGLPRWARQARPPWRDPVASRVDVIIPAWNLIVEADGRRWHTRVEDFERDRERDNDAVLNGFATLRFTWHRLVHDEAGVVSTVTRYGQRAHAA